MASGTVTQGMPISLVDEDGLIVDGPETIIKCSSIVLKRPLRKRAQPEVCTSDTKRTRDEVVRQRI